VAAEHFDLAMDWVSDIFLNSKIDAEEIEREKGVIIEEINMYLDTPTQYIGNLWEHLLYGGQPAGWDVIGTKENISKFKREDFLGYLKNHYSSKNTLVAVAGNFQEKDITNKIKKMLCQFRNQETPSKVKG